jgi:hypothetical protein
LTRLADLTFAQQRLAEARRRIAAKVVARIAEDHVRDRRSRDRRVIDGGIRTEQGGEFVDGVEIGLKPKFDPETTRYSLLASEPAGDLRVKVSAHRGLRIQIAGVAAVSGVAVALP